MPTGWDASHPRLDKDASRPGGMQGPREYIGLPGDIQEGNLMDYSSETASNIESAISLLAKDHGPMPDRVTPAMLASFSVRGEIAATWLRWEQL